MPETPFDSVEGAHEYVGLLLEAVREARGEVACDLHEAKAQGAKRRVEALHLVMWKLERLEGQLATSRHLLNDLRRLRLLLLGDDVAASRAPAGETPDEPWEG